MIFILIPTGRLVLALASCFHVGQSGAQYWWPMVNLGWPHVQKGLVVIWRSFMFLLIIKSLVDNSLIATG